MNIKIPAEYECINCGVICKSGPSKKNKFCSGKCCGQYKYKQNIKKWLNGELTGLQPNGKKTSTFVKRYMVETFGEKCQLCDWSEINHATGKVPIQLDHIDGNFRNCKISNLQLLCPNCHSLTPTFGNLNYKNGFNASERRY